VKIPTAEEVTADRKRDPMACFGDYHDTADWARHATVLLATFIAKLDKLAYEEPATKQELWECAYEHYVDAGALLLELDT
jgi:hypothetical protein